MKKILIFSLHYYPKHIGGAEVAIKEITDRVSMEDVEFHMVCLRMDSTLPKVEKVGKVLVHRIGFSKPNPSVADLRKFPLHLNKGFFQLTAFLKAVSLYRTHKYDAIWAMMAHSCGVPAGLFKRHFPEVKYILTLQEGDPPEYIERKMRVFGALFRRGFTSADVIQPISTFLGTWATRMGYQGRIEIIPNAVDTKHFSQTYASEEISVLQGALGIMDDDVALITTSRLYPKNAVDDVIRALPKLPDHVKFIICGIGPDEPMLRRLAEELNVSKRVHFAGQISHAIMPKYLKASHIFIRPSRSEGMGNSFIEAMAAEIPVIATQEGGIADFLFDAKRNPDKTPTGFAVDKDAPNQIAEQVRYIMDHPQEVQDIVAAAKAMAFEKYDWNLIAKDMQARVFA